MRQKGINLIHFNGDETTKEFMSTVWQPSLCLMNIFSDMKVLCSTELSVTSARWTDGQSLGDGRHFFCELPSVDVVSLLEDRRWSQP